MRVHLKAFMLALLVCFAANSARAIPAPMSDAELLERSDLVALVRVLSVTCTGISKDEHSGEDLHSYSAKLELLEVKKGKEKAGDVVTVPFHELPPGMVGPWSVFYYPGEEVWTHLAGGNGAYETTWWNARKQQLHAAVITELPTTRGETVSISEASQ